jgi:hypothetical protein
MEVVTDIHLYDHGEQTMGRFKIEPPARASQRRPAPARAPALLALLALLALPSATGCYTFTPLERTALSPGEEVRLTLSPAGVDLMSQITGRAGRAVEGHLVEWHHDEVVVAVPVPFAHARPQGSLPRQPVPIPMADVLLVERKMLDWKRTTLALAASSAVAGMVIWRAAGGGGGGLDRGDNGGPTFLRIPLDAR